MSERMVLHVVGCLVCLVALGLLVASQPTTYWTIIDLLNTEALRYGLYQICSIGSCRNLPWDVTFDYELAPMITRIILIVADVFVVGGFLACMIAFCLQNKGRKATLITSGVLNIIAGVLALSGVIAYTVTDLVKFLSDISDSIPTATYSFGYSYSFVWASGVLFIVAGVMLIISSTSQSSVGDYDQQPRVSWATTPYNKTTLPAGQANPYYRNSSVTSPY